LQDITVQLADDVVTRIAPMRNWLSTVLDLTLIGFKTPAVATATEIIEFLAEDPSLQEIINYHVTPRAQERLQRLLALNSADEQLELDELEKVEHIMIMLKAEVASQKYQSN
jgi:hypothetical protein